MVTILTMKEIKKDCKSKEAQNHYCQEGGKEKAKVYYINK